MGFCLFAGFGLGVLFGEFGVFVFVVVVLGFASLLSGFLRWEDQKKLPQKSFRGFLAAVCWESDTARAEHQETI